MGLEAADFIPELVDTNPLGNDPKSEGDDHLRLIKTAVQGSFPNFVGTAGVPASVALTEDEINDAALKSAAQVITGEWSHEASIIMAEGIGVFGLSGAVRHNIGAVGATNVSLGSNVLDASINGDLRATFRFQGSDHSFMTTSADGGILLQDLARLGFLQVGYRNPRRFAINADTDCLQNWEGQHVAVNTGNVDITMIPLDNNTKFRLFFATGNGNIIEGAGINLQRFTGTGRDDGDIATSLGSVWEMWMPTATIWYAVQIAG